MNEHEIKTLITEMTQEPQPASTIDVARAVRNGHRARRTRSLLQIGAVFATAGLIVGGMSVMATGRKASAPVMTPTGARFDPLVRSADFGWVPKGMTERSVYVGTRYMSLVAGTPNGRPYEFFFPQVGVTLFPVGQRIDSEVVTRMARDIDNKCPHGDQVGDTPRIGGRPTQWVYARDLAGSHCRSTPVELRWQYAAGAWAVAKIEPDAGLANQGVYLRIADNLRVGETAPVSKPFRLTYVPPGLHVIETTDDRSFSTGVKWRTSLDLSADADGPPTRGYPDDKHTPMSIRVEVSPVAAVDPADEDGPLNTTVDGHPAFWKKSGDGWEALRVIGVHGFQVRINAFKAGNGVPLRVLRGLRLLGPDRAAWTTRPVG
ncbi:hypothetical protein NE236_19395 [Actinoallomurus purpureus]|uniref:hypothetical protein n=1 Tax=Actinoallomurus purpureus TaxID=478114 RepID=UPI0020939960|nr:hypothetical protein [Actinoallomurus purpureus]MCO6007151.1 hypothetical protein [Actinoallomurus purpureus]